MTDQKPRTATARPALEIPAYSLKYPRDPTGTVCSEIKGTPISTSAFVGPVKSTEKSGRSMQVDGTASHSSQLVNRHAMCGSETGLLQWAIS